MVEILVIGDTHIPDRADHVPEKLMEIIEAGKPWEIVVFTGDLVGEEVFKWVRSLGRKVYIVRGNMDYLPLPKTAVFEIEGFHIGVHHGDGVYPRGDTKGLTRIANELRVNILFTGHTHSPFIKHGLQPSILLVNPGSLTGVWGGGGGSMKPSMMTIEILGDNLRIQHYELDPSWKKLSSREKKIVFRDTRWIM